MFDIGADELLLTAVVAIVVIGPKDLPRALRVAGRWVARMRRMSNAFRAGFENMVREAEMEDLQREWNERNAAIMAAHPTVTAETDAAAASAAAQGESPRLEHHDTAALPSAEAHGASHAPPGVQPSVPGAPPRSDGG